jgi:glycosyltransferase involved in cell wall biosynthesis
MPRSYTTLHEKSAIFVALSMKVSVIIPCYKSAGFIRQAVESVVNQTLADKELICVNDGSPDSTWEVLQELQKEFGEKIPFHVVDQSNAGACAARNTGLSRAHGEFVQFLDSDDQLAPGKLAAQVAIAEAGRADIVAGSYRRVKPDHTVMFTRKYEASMADQVFPLLLNTNLGITSSNLFRTAAVREVNGWDEHLKSSQEYDLMFRMIQRGAVVALDSEVHTTIIHRESGSISRTNEKANAERYVALRIRMRDYLRGQGNPSWNEEADRALFDSVRTLYRFDPSQAIAIFKGQFDRSFDPGLRNGSGGMYRALYLLLGFSLAEKAYKLLKR